MGSTDETKQPSPRACRAVLRSIALAAPWVLCGCNVGPDFKRPDVNVPEAWHTTAPESPTAVGPEGGAARDQETPPAPGESRIAQTTPNALWWKTFADPALDRLVELASHQNLPLQVAGLRITEARAKLSLAIGRQYPQVQELFANATAIGISKNVPIAAALPRSFVDYQLGFDAAWEVDLWGKYRRDVDAQSASLRASEADYDAALVSLTAEVARTYVTIRTFEVLVDEAQENARIEEDALKIAESRYRNGATSELDPAQATTLLESTRASIPQLLIGLHQAENALSTLLGQTPGRIESMLAGPKAIPKPPPTVAIGVPTDMLRRRPDVRSAELTAEAQSARIGVAKSQLYPSFSLAGTIGLEATTSGASQNPFSPDSIFYSVGPRINWPFLNYGRITNSVRVEDARFQELVVAYRDTVLRATQEVEDSLAGFRHAQEARVFEEGAVASARRSVDVAVAQYREGITDYQRVLDAQRSLLQQQNGLTQTSSAVVTNLIALYKALGGGWEIRRGQPIMTAQTQRDMKQRTNWDDMLGPPRAADDTKNPPPVTH